MKYLTMFKSRFAAVVMVALFTAIAAGACSTAAPDPTATPAPTATPTVSPTPTSTPTPIMPVRVDPEKDPVGFLNSIPANEVECGNKAVGGRDNLIAIISGKMEATDAQATALAKCMSRDTVMRVAVGQIEIQAGELSDATLSCIAGHAPDIGFDSFLNSQPDPAALAGVLQAVFCLNKDERAALEANASDGGFSFGGAGIDSMECFVNAVGPAKLADALGTLMASGDSGGSDPAVFQKMLPFMSDILKCGLIPEDEFAESPFTPEQLACLVENGGDGFAKFMASSQTGAPPDLAQLASVLPMFDKCGVDVSKLGGGQPPSPPGTPRPQGAPSGPQQISLTADQQACLLLKVGPDVLASLQTGSLDPAKLLPLLGALSQCNIDGTKLFAPPAPK